MGSTTDLVTGDLPPYSTSDLVSLIEARARELMQNLVRIERKLDTQAEQVERMVRTMDRFLPLLESYERAKNANGFLAARRAMKG